MTDNNHADIAEQSQEQVAHLVKLIYASRKAVSNNLECSTSLPANEPVDLRLATVAIVEILEKYFDITTNRLAKGRMKMGATVQFSHISQSDLPERNIAINLSRKNGHIVITGKEAENGKDSYSEVAFDWEKKSGRILDSGIIDWKKINSVPNITKGDLLVTVYDRTEGFPGIDCFGRPIQPSPGKRYPIKWDQKTIFRHDDPKSPNVFKLFATSSGAIAFTFRIDDDPSTLSGISISRTLTVNGDINYDYGDLTCNANLSIKGNLRGNFSLQSDGYVNVTGSIEGREIHAAEVTANLITNGCKVTATRTITAENINNAVAKGRNIIIKKNVSNSLLNAAEELAFHVGSSFLGITVHTKKFKLEGVRFTGINEIHLGEELIRQANNVTTEMETMATESDRVSESTKSAIKSIFSLLVDIEKIIAGEKPGSPIKKIMSHIKKSLVNNFRQTARIDEKLQKLLYEFESLLGDNNYNESVLRKVDKVLHHIQQYNAIQGEFVQAAKWLRSLREEFSSCRQQIAEELVVTLDNCITAGKNAELRIMCGNAVLVVDELNIRKNIQIKYLLPIDETILEDGILHIV